MRNYSFYARHYSIEQNNTKECLEKSFMSFVKTIPSFQRR